MDPVAGFDEDEHEDFFRGYAAEAESESPSEREDPDPSATSANKRRRSGSARFQKPVALFVGAMTLLSLTGLALRGLQPGSWVPSPPRVQPALVTHYAAALPAATPVVSVASPLAYEPVSWESVCAGPSMCLLDSSAGSAWLSVALTESVGSENNPPSGSYASTNRARRSSLGSRFSASAHLIPIAHLEPIVAAPKALAAAPKALVAAPKALVAVPKALVAAPKAFGAAPRVPTLSLAATPSQRAATPPTTVTPVARFPDTQ
jgi:hypothetical protein